MIKLLEIRDKILRLLQLPTPWQLEFARYERDEYHQKLLDLRDQIYGQHEGDWIMLGDKSAIYRVISYQEIVKRERTETIPLDKEVIHLIPLKEDGVTVDW
jgi:hypothetical protein